MSTSPVTGFRLSPLQQRLWTLLTSGVRRPLRVELLITVPARPARLDAATVSAALAAVAQRHELLRTRFVEVAGGEVLQCIADAAHLPVRTIDLDGEEPEAVAARLRAAHETEDSREDLTGERLCDVVFASGALHDYVSVELSPLLADRRSAWLLAREVMAACAGRGPDGPSEPLQYADIAEWKHALLESDHAEGGWLFWQSLAIDTRIARPLPSLRRVRTHDTFVHGCARGRRTPLSEAARQRLAEARTSVEALALGCWTHLCGQHLGDTRVMLGVVSDGRAEAETAACLGPMTGTLPLAIDLDPTEPAADLAARISGQLASARVWQDLFRWERLSSLSRDDAPTAFCRVAFEYADVDGASDDGPDGSWSMETRRADTDAYELKLVCLAHDGTLATHLDYDAAAIEDAEAARLVAWFDRLLERALHAPASSLTVLTDAIEPAADRAGRVLSGTPTTLEATLVSELFERQASRTPDAIAIVEGHACLTFAALNRRANRTARLLRDLGLAPEDRVGLRLSRGIAACVAVLGILKAGGAFVPLGEAPPARVRAIVDACGIDLLLADDDSAAVPGATEAHTLTGVRVVSPLASAGQPASNLPARVSAANLAYVLFTSGSTGTPKGVMVSHGAAVNYLGWACSAYDRPDTTGSLWHSPLDFDFTLTTLFVPLLTGRPVIVAPPGAIEYVSETLSTDAALTFVKLTPAHLRAARYLTPWHPAAARVLVAGGERLTTDDLAWLASAPDTVVVNEYGPTETTVGCCVYQARVEDVLREAHRDVPIGVPIRNTTVQVLTAAGTLALPGVRGELAIGGDGVARGYIGRPDLTAASFRPDAHAGPPGARVYHTGDLVRLRPDRQLVYGGRADSQVKLHGFRIELDEIAATARRLTWVDESAAVVTEDAAGQARLALVVRTEPTVFDEDALRACLAAWLPAYMVPAIVVRVASIPITPHGKVDAHALARLVSASGPAAAAPRRPTTQAERDLTEIWRTVLKRDDLSVDEPFFAAGGDSIRSIQILGLARQRGYALTLADMLAAPTIRQLAHRIGVSRVDTIPDAARAPFALLAPEDRLRVPPEVEDAYPMTAMQEGMLFHSEWGPRSATYHDIVGVHLEAPYDRAALASSVRAAAASHQVLRTVFDLHRFSQPVQLVLRHAEPVVEEHDLRDRTAPEQEAAIAAWLAEEKDRRFAWDEAPPYGICVQRRSPSSFQFNVSFHHALLDGWSTASLLIEVLQRYAAALGQRVELPSAPRSALRDYVFLEQAARRDADTRAFWQRYLDDAPSTLCAWHGDAATRERGAGVQRRERLLPRDTTRRLEAIARQLGVPLKTVLLAAHATVIGTLTNRVEIVTGVVSNGRVDDVDGERALGLFLNTLPLRVAIARRSWAALIREIYDHEVRWAPHRRLPLSDIVRDLGTTDLFDSAFNFVHYHIYRTLPPLSGLRVRQTYAFEETSFALLANVVKSGGSDDMTLLLDADRDRMPADLDSVADLYVHTLEAVAANVDAAVGDCEMVSARQAVQIRAWASAPPAAAPRARADRQVLARALRCPDAIALVDGDAHLSYRRLVARARRVAGWLARQRIGAEQVVALDLERGVDLMVVTLGTLLAGATYVYIDRSLPDERRQFLIRDSRPRLIVTDRADARRDADDPARTWTARALLTDADAMTATVPLRDDHVESGAYLVYTSGSTGTPKGIVMPHRPLADLIAWQITASAEPAPRTLQSTTLSFDVSFQEIFSTWGGGGTLVLIREGLRDQPIEMWRLLHREEIERLFLPCAALRQVAAVHAHAKTADRLALREIITAGDVLHLTPDVVAFLNDLSSPTLTNQYGPAETHVVTSYTMAASSRPWPARPGIGGAVAGAGVYLLNGRLHLTPIGSLGEIHLGGDAVSRGYLNRADLTAARFVPDARSGRMGARLYRTGDLARFHADGTLEFLGRRDHQIKVLGHRIELGEIERAIDAVPDVATAVVDHAIAPDGERQLVAYLVPRGDADVAIARVSAHLGRTLPRYMMPARFVTLDALPRTVSGKVDRPRLPRAGGREAPRRPRIPPADATEAAICAIWQRALQRDDLGVEDDFFEVGGHSLTATRIVIGIRADLRVDLPIKAVYDLRTVRGLARDVVSRRPPAPVVVPRVPRDDALMLAPQQAAYWAHAYAADHLHPNNIHVALRLPGRLRFSALEQALAQLQRRHEALRTAFVLRDTGDPLPVISPAGAAAVRLATLDLRHLEPDVREVTLKAVSRHERARPFDLARGPCCRATIVRMAADDQVLLFTTHHLVCDGWSIAVLTRELSTTYEAAIRGVPAALDALAYEYVDFARWQHEWLAGGEAALHLAYWREHLALPLPDLLPVVGPDEYVSIRRHTRVVMDAAVADCARRLARAAGCTLFATVLAAWKLALSASTGQADVRVATFASGRTLPGTEHIVGLFSNLVCLRTRVDRAIGFVDLVRAVQRTISEAMAHQALPFDVVARALQPAISASGSRLFQVLALWQALPVDTLRVSGVEPRLAHRDEQELVVMRQPPDLKIDVVETPGALHSTLAYKVTRFADADIHALVDAVDRCLMRVDRDPAITVAALWEAITRRTHVASDASGPAAESSR